MTTCHIGGWYGGPGMWCACRTQECGYCGSVIAASPGEDPDDYKTYDEQDRVVIDRDEIIAAIRALPEPTLGLKGGVSRAAVIALLEGLGA